MGGSLLAPVLDLRRRLGSQRELSRRIAASDIAELTSVAGTSVPADGEIAVDLVIESVPEGIMVHGSLVVPWQAECRRCLEVVTGEVQADVRELFEPIPTPGETYPLDEATIDLEPMVRDSVLLSLPLSVVCRQDCPGPAPDRFPATVEDSEPAAKVDDPRWDALREIRFED